MPEKSTLKRARQDKREGKSASTQAGEFVHEEIEHIREGKHGARSTKQAIAIGLSKARRAGVDLPPPKKGKASEETRHKAQQDVEAGTRRTSTIKAAAKKTTARTRTAKKTAKRPSKAVSKTRSRATSKALKREGSTAASRSSLSKQAKTASRKRTATERSAAAKKAARTKGAEGRSTAAKKAARTRARHEGRGRHDGAAAHA